MSAPTGSADTGRHAAVERLRRARRRIADQDVEKVIERLESGGITPLVTEWVHRERGRPATLSAQGLLAGLFLTAADNSGRITLTQVTETLYFEISPRMRARLGITSRPDTDKGFEAAYAVVRRRFHRMIDACDPSPLPKNKRLQRAEAARLEASADPSVLAEHRARLVRLTGLIMQDSLEPARDLLDRYWDGSAAVDGTAVRTYAKGLRSAGPVTATDPDAAWHVRTGDHAEPQATGTPGKKKRKTEMKYGYEATLAVSRNPQRDGAPLPDGRPNPFVLPALAVGFILDKPGHAPGRNATTVLADVRRRGHKANWLAGDRLFNNSDPRDFQLPVRALGYRPVFDYTIDQLGIHTQANGAIQVEGTWYCPSMPQPLIDATIDLHAERIDPATWKARIQAREPYRLYPKQRPDAEGHQRLACPATAGKVHCPLKPPLDPAHPRRHLLPVVDPLPAPVGRPKICRQTGITQSPEAGAKHAQDLDYGGPEWTRVYFRLRNSVEGVNGFAKDPAHEAIEAAGTRRIRGIAAQSLLLAFQLHHTNTRKIANWLDTLPGLDGSPPRRRPTRRRKTKPITAWTPAGYLTALPEAA